MDDTLTVNFTETAQGFIVSYPEQFVDKPVRFMEILREAVGTRGTAWCEDTGVKISFNGKNYNETIIFSRLNSDLKAETGCRFDFTFKRELK